MDIYYNAVTVLSYSPYCVYIVAVALLFVHVSAETGYFAKAINYKTNTYTIYMTRVPFTGHCKVLLCHHQLAYI